MARNQATKELREAHRRVLAGEFTAALATLAPLDPAAPGVALLSALARAGAGDAEGAAPGLAAIAAANASARHPVLDLLPLVPKQDAVLHLRAALRLRPEDRGVLAALGALLAEVGPITEAVRCFEQGVALAPADPASWSNLGKARAALGQFDDADTAFRRARGLAPNDARYAYHHGVMLLKAGRWDEGWEAFRARHALPGRPPAPPGARLTSLDVAGRTVLLVHDEGFGDTLQFIRYAAPLAARGARVVAAVPAALARLVATAPGVASVSVLPALPRYDLWTWLLDVPALFGAPLPAPGPYLRPDGAPPALPPGRRVGLVWAGDPRGLLDTTRSMPVEALETLRAVPGVTWVSLQKDRAAPGWCVDPMPGVRDFADTAAIVAALDDVVSVDTAVAHLAGALGKRVVLLDRFDNCWRWLSGRTDSVWYPTLTIVRQTRPGDWDGVVARAAAALSG